MYKHIIIKNEFSKNNYCKTSVAGDFYDLLDYIYLHQAIGY